MFEDSQAQFEDFGSMGGQLPLSAFPEQRFESPAMELTLGKLTQEDLLLADVRGSDAGFAEGVPTLPSCGFTTTTGQAPLHDGSEVLPGLKHVPEEQFGDTQLQWSLLQFADTQVELDPMDQPQYGSERISLDEQQWHADQVQNWYGSEVHAGLGLEYMPVLDAPHQDQVQQVYGSEIPLHFGIESHVADTQQFWAPTEPRQCDGPGVPACPYADTQVQGEPSDAVCLDGQDIPCEDVEDSESCSPTEIEPSESSDKAQSPPRDREKAGFFTMRLHVITMQHHFLTIYIYRYYYSPFQSNRFLCVNPVGWKFGQAMKEAELICNTFAAFDSIDATSTLEMSFEQIEGAVHTIFNECVHTEACLAEAARHEALSESAKPITIAKPLTIEDESEAEGEAASSQGESKLPSLEDAIPNSHERMVQINRKRWVNEKFVTYFVGDEEAPPQDGGQHVLKSSEAEVCDEALENLVAAAPDAADGLAVVPSDGVAAADGLAVVASDGVAAADGLAVVPPDGVLRNSTQRQLAKKKKEENLNASKEKNGDQEDEEENKKEKKTTRKKTEKGNKSKRTEKTKKNVPDDKKTTSKKSERSKEETKVNGEPGQKAKRKTKPQLVSAEEKAAYTARHVSS